MNKEKDMENKNRKGSLADRIPHQVWLLISFAAAMVLWTLLSVIPATSRAFPNVFKVLGSIKTMIDRGVLWKDISSSLISVISGYALGFVIALPVAILMAWYKPVRFVIEPWIQFIRNIPPLAYVPLIVIAEGVINVDETLIKAARVLGATDKDIFIRVIAPATLPFILTAIRLGASVALTTLIAAESTGAMAGLGMRIRSLNNSFEAAPMLLYIIIIGILGITIEKLIKTAERRLTSWQEKREI